MEGRVFWHYTCPICNEIFHYSMIAGPAVNICYKCEKEGED